jgi:hypothetical protein
MDSLRPILLMVLALGAGSLALLNLTHLAVMGASRLRLVAMTWLLVTLALVILTTVAILAFFHASAIWIPLLLGLVIGAPVSRELADVLAWRRDRGAATSGWLARIDGKGWLGFRGHIYRAAAATERARFESYDESQDPWLVHWAADPPRPATAPAAPIGSADADPGRRHAGPA